MIDGGGRGDRPGAAVEEGTDYAALRADLARAVRRVCPRWLADRSEDLVQVAMLRVMEVERKSEGKRDFGASYLSRVAYSALVDEIRRLRRRQEVPIDTEDRQDAFPATGPGPQQSFEGGEIGRGIRACLALMVPPRRQAVTLHLLGHGVPEVARLMGWVAKRAENLVYRGLDDLRRCLRAKGLAPEGAR